MYYIWKTKLIDLIVKKWLCILPHWLAMAMIIQYTCLSKYIGLGYYFVHRLG